jgi:tetratricopeptide (TPR) repeat protein
MPTTQKNNLTDSSIEAKGNVHIGDIINNGSGEQKPAFPISLTDLIPTNAAYIVGRTDELVGIQQQLQDRNTAVLVNGIGGMGKTTVAKKYMVEYGQQYAHRAWLNAAAGLREAFINNRALLDSLHIRKEVEDLVNGQQLQAAFECVVKKLKDLPSALVVIDNANHLSDLVECKKYFDAVNCHFIITSRADPQGWAIIHIDALPESDAVRLFKNIHPSVSETNKDLKILLKYLFYHPLLIELVAKTAKANALDTAKLKQSIQDNFIHGTDLKKRKIDVAPHSDATNEAVKRATIEDYIWLIFQNVHNLYDHAKDLLRAFTLLPPATTFDEDFLETHFAQWHLTENMYDTLDIQLVESGWLERDYSAEKPSYKMHPLIADAVVKHLDVQVDFAESYIISLAKWIHYEDTEPEHDLGEKNKSKPLAERLSSLFFKENTGSVAYLLDRLGTLEAEFGFYNKAVFYKKRGLEIVETIFDKNHRVIGLFQNNLGFVYGFLGNDQLSLELLEAALSSINDGEESELNTPTCQSNLAVVNRRLGNHTRAIELLEMALESDTKNYGKEHPRISRYLSNLGNVYRDLGDYTRAAALLETALAIKLKFFDVEHHEVAKIQNNLAYSYYGLGRYTEAITLWQLAYPKMLKKLGPTHPYTVRLKEFFVEPETKISPPSWMDFIFSWFKRRLQTLLRCITF